MIRRIFVLALVAFSSTLAAQSTPRPTAIIGGEDDRGAALDDPEDFAVVGDRIIVLDSDAPYLKVFRLDGRLVQTVGRKGAGPGEFQAAYRLSVDSATRRVFVYDRANARATLYALNDSLSLTTTLRLPSRLEGTCVVGTRQYAMGFFEGKLVHELEQRSDELRVVRSFGVARANHELDGVAIFQSSISDGRLVCDDKSSTVIAISATVGVAQIIDLRTGTQRTVPLTGVTPLTFKAVDSGGRPGVAQSTQADHFDNVDAAWSSTQGVRFLAERIYDETKDGATPSTVTEWLLTPSGRLQKGATTRQREIGRSGASIVCYARNPIPTIEVYRAARCP